MRVDAMSGAVARCAQDVPPSSRRCAGSVIGMPSAPEDPLARVRSLCLALPEAFEVEAWSHPTFRVGGGRGKMFCLAAEDGSSIRLKADPIEREALLDQGQPFYLP